MTLVREELTHPTQPSRVRLSLFPQERGFLLTEERIGTVTVYRTLGLFDEREAAEARLRARRAELLQQRYNSAGGGA